MAEISWIDDLFSSIDRMDTEAFVGFITEDGTFRFGNWPAAEGRDAIGKTVSDFLAGLAGVSHRLVGSWRAGDVTVVEGEVTYTRHDGSDLTVPFANIFRHGKDDRIANYRVFADVHELFA